MYTTEPLSSEKYWQAIVQQEEKAVRHSRNQKAIRDFVTFLVGLAAMALGIYLVEHQQQWLSVVNPWMQAIARQTTVGRWF